MSASKRRFEPSVIQRLFDTPYRFQFFQAVRMVELWFKRNGIPRERAVAEFVRFANRTSLGFPPSEIEQFSAFPREIEPNEPAMLAALQGGTLRYVSLTPTFMGFLGSNGALPSHYSERFAAHQATTRDEGPRVFLDTFSNRSLALFYEAWRKYRLELQYESGAGDRFLPLLLALSGLGYRSLHGRHLDEDGMVLDESMGHFAAAMRHRPASAAYMQRVLSAYFDAPIAIEQFIGCWYDVPPEHQTKLGSTNATLGTAAMVGERVWQRDLRLRLRIGPLDQAQFERFLPGASAANALAKMLTMFTSVCLEYEIELVLSAQDVVGSQLNTDRGGGRLGWDTFLSTAPELHDRSDVRYEVHALSAT
ncbi:MAG: type VI secretion system baseplate subunit TssG [Pseudomonadota bacterium]|nr:type VI secretion system baseplate subunit TssG [Pseudomonadota bacterium]